MTHQQAAVKLGIILAPLCHQRMLTGDRLHQHHGYKTAQIALASNGHIGVFHQQGCTDAGSGKGLLLEEVLIQKAHSIQAEPLCDPLHGNSKLDGPIYIIIRYTTLFKTPQQLAGNLLDLGFGDLFPLSKQMAALDVNDIDIKGGLQEGLAQLQVIHATEHIADDTDVALPQIGDRLYCLDIDPQLAVSTLIIDAAYNDLVVPSQLPHGAGDLGNANSRAVAKRVLIIAVSVDGFAVLH